VHGQRAPFKRLVKIDISTDSVRPVRFFLDEIGVQPAEGGPL